MARIVLETRGLSMRFGGVSALDAVNFRLREREVRCLVGPNGAGKSTFFKCVVGMHRPSAGQIRIRGRDTTGWRVDQVAALGVGIKTQVPSLFDALSAREHLWLASRGRPADEVGPAIETLLDRVGLVGIGDQAVGSLAHGKRQLVEFALVMALRPWLVLLDEPAAGMSDAERENAAALIAEISQSATVVVVEHDMAFVRQIAHKTTVFHRGRVLVEGETETVLADPVVQAVYLGREA